MKMNFFSYTEREIENFKLCIDYFKEEYEAILPQNDNLEFLLENMKIFLDDHKMAWEIIYFMTERLCRAYEVNTEDIDDVIEHEIAYAIKKVNAIKEMDERNEKINSN